MPPPKERHSSIPFRGCDAKNPFSVESKVGTSITTYFFLALRKKCTDYPLIGGYKGLSNWRRNIILAPFLNNIKNYRHKNKIIFHLNNRRNIIALPLRYHSLIFVPFSLYSKNYYYDGCGDDCRGQHRN